MSRRVFATLFLSLFTAVMPAFAVAPAGVDYVAGTPGNALNGLPRPFTAALNTTTNRLRVTFTSTSGGTFASDEAIFLKIFDVVRNPLQVPSLCQGGTSVTARNNMFNYLGEAYRYSDAAQKLIDRMLSGDSSTRWQFEAAPAQEHAHVADNQALRLDTSLWAAASNDAAHGYGVLSVALHEAFHAAVRKGLAANQLQYHSGTSQTEEMTATLLGGLTVWQIALAGDPAYGRASIAPMSWLHQYFFSVNFIWRKRFGSAGFESWRFDANNYDKTTLRPLENVNTEASTSVNNWFFTATRIIDLGFWNSTSFQNMWMDYYYNYYPIYQTGQGDRDLVTSWQLDSSIPVAQRRRPDLYCTHPGYSASIYAPAPYNMQTGAGQFYDYSRLFASNALSSPSTGQSCGTVR